MTRNDSLSQPEALLRELYDKRTGCPAPETFLTAEWDDLTDIERDRLERHVADCPACQAERRLAQAFDAGDAALDPAAIEAVAGKLKIADNRQALRLRRWLPGAVALAAAILLAVALAPALTGILIGAPPVAGPGSGPLTRGAAMQISAPVGDVESAPTMLRFEPLASAARYEVVIAAVDGRTIWQHSSTDGNVAIPGEIRAALRPAVTYHWRVSAFGANDERVAWSDMMAFRILVTPPPN